MSKPTQHEGRRSERRSLPAADTKNMSSKQTAKKRMKPQNTGHRMLYMARVLSSLATYRLGNPVCGLTVPRPPNQPSIQGHVRYVSSAMKEYPATKPTYLITTSSWLIETAPPCRAVGDKQARPLR